jgi:hypothetical protein
LKQSEEVGLQVMSHHVGLSLALAETRLGEYESAVERLEKGIAYREQIGVTGLNLGLAYETRARVAIAMRDAPGFTRAAAACAREYGRGHGGSSLAPRYEALRAEARQAGLLTASEAPPAPAFTDPLSTLASAFTNGTALDDPSTAALSALLTASGARSGALYRLRPGVREPGAPLPLPDASTPGFEPPAEAMTSLQALIDSDMDEDTIDPCTSAPPPGLPQENTERWIPYALGRTTDAGYEITGAALLRFTSGVEHRTLEPDLMLAIGRMLGEESR